VPGDDPLDLGVDPGARVAILAVLGFLAGIAILFGGAVAALTPVGVLGFFLAVRLVPTGGALSMD